MSLGDDGFCATNVENPSGINILVTGAGGYIGSHACLALLEAGFNVIALDNMVNCWKDERLPQPESLIRVQILAGRQLKFYHGDILCKPSLTQIFKEIIQEYKKIDVCMHFAALKAVGESCAKPLEYYKNNITGTINLIELLETHGCKKLVYSSSATVYGDPENLPISEKELTGVGLTNPYGKTKFMTEEILKDLCNAVQIKEILSDPRGHYSPQWCEHHARNILTSVMKDMLDPYNRPFDEERWKDENDFLRVLFQTFVNHREKLPVREDYPRGASCTSPEGKTKFICEEILKDLTSANKDWSVISLRYFNPVGAHASGLIGEDPNGIPNNLVPFVAQVAAGKLEKLKVFGDDYPTKDGTGVRDYIHITDLINGHLKALEPLLSDFKGFKAYNLGTGKGYSVLDVIRAFKEASGRDIPYEIVERRPGDIAASYCNASLAEKELDWIAVRDINDMCRDVWRWQSRNINGFRKETDPNCLLHSPHKLDLLLASLTQTELQKADRKLHLDAIDRVDRIKMLEDFEKLKRLREVLKAAELVRLSKEPCKRYYNQAAELPGPPPVSSLQVKPQAAISFKERMEAGLEELKKVRAMVKNMSKPGAQDCDCLQTVPGAPQLQDMGLPFCACGR